MTKTWFHSAWAQIQNFICKVLQHAMNFHIIPYNIIHTNNIMFKNDLLTWWDIYCFLQSHIIHQREWKSIWKVFFSRVFFFYLTLLTLLLSLCCITTCQEYTDSFEEVPNKALGEYSELPWLWPSGVSSISLFLSRQASRSEGQTRQSVEEYNFCHKKLTALLLTTTIPLWKIL